MLKKIDNALKLIWFLFWPVLMAALIIVAAWDLFVWENPELGILWLNISCLCALITLCGWLVNFILDIVMGIIRRIEKKNEEKDNGLQ